MKRHWRCLCLSLMVSAAASASQLSAQFRAWFPDFSANALLSDNNQTGTEFDAEQDLRIDDPNFPEVRVNWQFGKRNSLWLDYLAMEYRGSNPSLNRVITINDTTFAVNGDVTSTLHVNVVRAVLEREWCRNRVFDFSTLAELKVIWGKGRFQSVANNVDEEQSLVVPLPTLGAAVNLRPTPYTELFGMVSGLYFGDYGHVVDWEAGLRLVPTANSPVTAELGWRQFNLEVSDEQGANPNFGELDFSGPFVSFNAGF